MANVNRTTSTVRMTRATLMTMRVLLISRSILSSVSKEWFSDTGSSRTVPRLTAESPGLAHEGHGNHSILTLPSPDSLWQSIPRLALAHAMASSIVVCMRSATVPVRNSNTLAEYSESAMPSSF